MGAGVSTGTEVVAAETDTVAEDGCISRCILENRTAI